MWRWKAFAPYSSHPLKYSVTQEALVTKINHFLHLIQKFRIVLILWILYNIILQLGYTLFTIFNSFDKHLKISNLLLYN